MDQHVRFVCKCSIKFIKCYVKYILLFYQRKHAHTYFSIVWSSDGTILYRGNSKAGGQRIFCDWCAYGNDLRTEDVGKPARSVLFHVFRYFFSFPIRLLSVFTESYYKNGGVECVFYAVVCTVRGPILHFHRQSQSCSHLHFHTLLPTFSPPPFPQINIFTSHSHCQE